MGIHRTRRTLLLVLAAAVMIAIFAAFFAVFRGLPANAAPAGLPPAHWLMKADDVARVEAVGPVPAMQWVSCGGPQPDVLPCSTRGNVPTFTDYYVFRRWVGAGGRGTVLIDYEGWSFTPRWQRTHMARYLRLAGQLAAAHGVTTIMAPVTSAATVPTDMVAADVIAARYSPVVSIQRQWMTREPAQYAAFLRGAVPRIRAANPHVTVVVNLAADASGHPVTAAALTAAYDAVRPYGDGIWLNASLWTAAKGGTGCATSGCPLVVLAFLRDIGA